MAPATAHDFDGDWPRPQVREGGADWVRWAIGLALAASISANGFMFNLSNQVTALQTIAAAVEKERERERGFERDQRTETLQTIRNLGAEVGLLKDAVTVLSQSLPRRK